MSETLELKPGETYEVVISKDDEKSPGKVYTGEFHHADQFALVLIVDDPAARGNVVRVEDRDEKGVPRIGAVFEADGKRQFGIPLSRIGEIREPGKKGVKRNATPSAGE